MCRKETYDIVEEKTTTKNKKNIIVRNENYFVNDLVEKKKKSWERTKTILPIIQQKKAIMGRKEFYFFNGLAQEKKSKEGKKNYFVNDIVEKKVRSENYFVNDLVEKTKKSWKGAKTILSMIQ